MWRRRPLKKKDSAVEDSAVDSAVEDDRRAGGEMVRKDEDEEQQKEDRERTSSGDQQQPSPPPRLPFKGALDLQSELIRGFGGPEFQHRQQELLQEHEKRISSVWTEVVPKCGFEPTAWGLTEVRMALRRAMEEEGTTDPEISAKAARIAQLTSLGSWLGSWDAAA